jgi:hypothetical protein
LTVSKVISFEREVHQVKVAKTSRPWKFEFCRDMSLDLGVLALRKQVNFSKKFGLVPMVANK